MAKLIKSMAGLKGKIVASASHVQGITYLKFQDGDYAVLRGGKPAHTLNFEDQVALGLVTKADLDALKRLKKLGLAMDAPVSAEVEVPKEKVYLMVHVDVPSTALGNLYKRESDAVADAEENSCMTYTEFEVQ